MAIDVGAGLAFLVIGGTIMLLGVGSVGEAGLGLGLGLETLFGSEGLEAIFASVRELTSL